MTEVSAQFAQVVENLEQIQVQTEETKDVFLSPEQHAPTEEQSGSAGASKNQ